MPKQPKVTSVYLTEADQKLIEALKKRWASQSAAQVIRRALVVADALEKGAAESTK